MAIKACSLTGWQVAGFRSGIAAGVLLVFLPEARRGWTWRTWAAGAAYAATLVSFALANKLTTAANAIYLQSTAPLYMLVLGPLVLREKVRRADLVVFAAVGAGAAMVLFSSGSRAAVSGVPAGGSAQGNLLAVLSGFAWACTLTSLRWLGRKRAEAETTANPAAAAVIAGNLIAFAACLPAALPVARVGAADAAALLYLGIFQVGLAYVFLTRSIRHVPAFEAATLLLAEPVFNPVWAWALAREAPGIGALAGGVLIVGAAFVSSVTGSRRP